MNARHSLKTVFAELMKRGNDLFVTNSHAEIPITDGFVITKYSLNHIVQRRGVIAKRIIFSLSSVLKNPCKISDNSAKRVNSYLYCKKVGNGYIQTRVP